MISPRMISMCSMVSARRDGKEGMTFVSCSLLRECYLSQVGIRQSSISLAGLSSVARNSSARLHSICLS
eukprot:6978304-Heterocapsa_arctica.AAC.1